MVVGGGAKVVFEEIARNTFSGFFAEDIGNFLANRGDEFFFAIFSGLERGDFLFVVIVD